MSKPYLGKWEVSEVAKFSESDIALVKYTEILSAQNGLSLGITLKDNMGVIIPLSSNSSGKLYQRINLSDVFYITLFSEEGKIEEATFEDMSEYNVIEKSIIPSLKHYDWRWSIVGKPESLDSTSISIIKEIKVIQGNYGPTAKFTYIDGNISFFSMLDEDPTPIGAYLDKEKIALLELRRGQETVYRLIPDKNLYQKEALLKNYKEWEEPIILGPRCKGCGKHISNYENIFNRGYCQQCNDRKRFTYYKSTSKTVHPEQPTKVSLREWFYNKTVLGNYIKEIYGKWFAYKLRKKYHIK